MIEGINEVHSVNSILTAPPGQATELNIVSLHDEDVGGQCK